MRYEEDSDTSLGAHTTGLDSKILYAELLKYGGYRQGAIRKLSPSQFTSTWLENNGTFRPVLIPAPSQEIGAAAIVKTPAGGITAETLVASLGPTTPVHTFDSPSQEEGPLWTLHQWKLYWNKKTLKQSKPQDGGVSGPAAADTAAAPSKPSDTHLEGIDKDYLTRLFCLPALSITGTSLESEFSAPTAVLTTDLCSSLNVAKANLPIMLGMYSNKSFANSTMAPGGASVWIHLVSGTATIAVSPPVAKNLSTYAAWACGGKTTGIFLPSKCEGSAKAELVAGDTLLLPPGYSYSLAVTSTAVIVSGGFLRSDSLAIHLDALRIENAAGVRLHRQYPEFKQLMWHAARKYSILLAGKAENKIESFETKVASRALEIEREDKNVAEKSAARAKAQAAAAAAKAASRPSSAAGAANRQGGAGVGGSGQRRRKRKTDDFIASDSDWSGRDGDEDDDEGEWVPGARQYRGKAESESNSGEEEEDDDILDSDAEQMDFEYAEDDDDDEGGGGRIERRRRKKEGGRSTVRVVGERQSKRQRARRGEEVPQAVVALNLTGVPSSSLKLKLKLPAMNTAAPVEQKPKPSPIKLTIKRPTEAKPENETAPPPPAPPTRTTIPQVDGAVDDGENHIELSEGEEQGLPVLYVTLRRWLRESPAAAVMATTTLSSNNNNLNPWEVLARFELALKALKLLDAADEDHPPPVCVNLAAVSIKTLEPTGAPFQEKLTIYSGGDFTGGGGGNGDNYVDDGDSMDYESGDNAAMIDEYKEDSYFKKRSEGYGGGGVVRPSSAMGAASDGKGASNAGGLGGVGGDTAAAGPNSLGTKATGTTKATPGGGTGSKAGTLSKTAAAKMKKLSTKDRLKKKLGL